MSDVTDEMVEVALDAYADNEWRTSASAMRAALAAVAPMIAAAEREACARVVNDRRAKLIDDSAYWGGPDMTNQHIIEPELLALDRAIRARTGDAT